MKLLSYIELLIIAHPKRLLCVLIYAILRLRNALLQKHDRHARSSEPRATKTRSTQRLLLGLNVK